MNRRPPGDIQSKSAGSTKQSRMWWFTEKKPDCPRPELAEFFDVRLDHRVSLQPTLAERQRGHVPDAVGFREINPEPDRLRGGERGTTGDSKQRENGFHRDVSG